MANVKLSNVIRRAQTKVDKDNTDLIFYVGGEHIVSENIRVHSRGIIAESTIGPMFYYGFKAGDFLLVSRNPHPVSRVFDPDSKVIFEIPKYQREYTWGSREWEALFDDLTENDDGYFLGSIICINSATDTINAPKFEVVDGQQRLTTLSLFLAALYTTLNSYKDLLDEDQQSDILQLKRKLVLKKTQSDIRVVPQIQGSNRDDFMGLLAKIGIIPKRPMPKFAGLRRIEKA